MKNNFISILIICFLAFQLNAQTDSQGLLLRNVYIVNVEAQTLDTTLQDIHIKDGKIERITPSFQRTDRGHVNQFDGQGSYLIPGLWDMHAHPDDPEVWRMRPVPAQRDLLMPQFVLHGVTGIRDMAGSLEVVKEWRNKIAKGELLGPVIYAAGPLLDGPNPMWDGSVGIDDPEAVPRIVDSLVEAGVDFLKVYSLLPGEIYFALSEYANEKGIPFVGHVPYDVTCSEAAESGMKSQEHCLEILQECSALSDSQILQQVAQKSSGSRLQDYVNRQKLLLEHFDEEKAQQLYATFVKHKTWHTPTLSMWYKNAWYEEEVNKDQELIQFLPIYLRRYWTPEINDHLRYRIPLMLELKQMVFDQYQKIVGDMHKAGVKLLCGTDMGANPLCFPGIGVHNELEMLVQAGLSPAEALQTATINPAIFLNIEGEYGSIAVNKIADLVLLKDNPLKDIKAVRNIFAIVKNGQLIDQKAREKYFKEMTTQLNKK